MLYLAGVIVPIFLLILLTGKRRKSTPDKILVFWLSFAIIHLLYFYWFVTKEYLKIPYLLGWELPLPLLHGPFLYLYVQSLTSGKPFNYKSLMHFVPFILAYLLLIPLLTLPGTERLNLYQFGVKGFKNLFTGLTAAIIISGITYVTLSLVALRSHRKNIADRFSNTDKITLNWLNYLIYGLAVIWVFVIFYRTPQTLFISVALFIFFIGYFGIRQVGIFSNNSINSFQTDNLQVVTDVPVPNGNTDIAEAPESSLPKIKYEKSALTNNDAQSIHKAMTRAMTEEQLFKNAELTLTDLAKHINIHPNTLSQVINSIENKSFYDYVNELRVEEFKRISLLPENKNLTLLGLAFECGFNSKSAFNRNFKKITDLSPSDYLKSVDGK